MNIPFERLVNSLNEASSLANELSNIFVEGDFIVLNGNIGSGKTTFIKLISNAYDINNVVSPSFSIVNEYSAKKKVYHFDFYRLKKIEELYDIGFEDYINDSEAIIFVEWGYLIKEIIPSKHYEIKLEMLEDEQRRFSLFKHN